MQNDTNTATADRQDTADDIFGDVIYAYTRAQAIADGELVDLTPLPILKEAGFRVPVAMTLAAYAAAISAGGKYIQTPAGDEVLTFTGPLSGQSVDGRLWDVLTVLNWTIKYGHSPRNPLPFKVLVLVGPGQHRNVYLVCHSGPGDDGKHVLTIMLPNED